jgi:hypothetical protein
MTGFYRSPGIADAGRTRALADPAARGPAIGEGRTSEEPTGRWRGWAAVDPLAGVRPENPTT